MQVCAYPGVVEVVVEERLGFVAGEHLVCLGDPPVHLSGVSSLVLIRMLR